VSGPPPSKDERVALQETLYTSRNPTRRWLHVTRRDWIREAMAECAAAVGTTVEDGSDAGPAEDAAPNTTAALEVGPGSGVYLPTLLEHFGRVTAVDIEEAHLDDLMPRFPDVRIVRDDITDSVLPDASFDLILCSESWSTSRTRPRHYGKCTGSCVAAAGSCSPRRSATAHWSWPRRWPSCRASCSWCGWCTGNRS